MKKFESTQRILAVLLAIFMIAGLFPMLPAVLVMAEGGSTDWEELQGTNWDEEPGVAPNFWPVRPEDRIYNTGGAAIDPMRISTISYTNYFFNDVGNLVYEFSWRNYFATTSTAWKTVELKLDDLLSFGPEGQVLSFQILDTDGIWQDLEPMNSANGYGDSFAPNTFAFRRDEIFKLGLPINEAINIPIRLTIKKRSSFGSSFGAGGQSRRLLQQSRAGYFDSATYVRP